MVFMAISFSYSDGGGRGTGGAVSVARTSGDTPDAVFVHSKFLRYLLGAQSRDLIFVARFGAIRFDVGYVFADRTGMEPTAGSRTSPGVVPSADFSATLRRGGFTFCFRVLRARSRSLARSGSVVIEMGDSECLELVVVTECDVTS
jgi:hypothetical protein